MNETTVNGQRAGGHIIEDEGVKLRQAHTLNFVGAGIGVATVGGKSVVTVNGNVSGPASAVDNEVTVFDGVTGKLIKGGGITITALKSMRNIWLSATGQAEGNRTLADATNWAAQYTYISRVKIKTSATDWDAWLCKDSDFDTTDIETIQIMEAGNGNVEIFVGAELNSANNNVYLKFTDNVAANTFDILISGEARRH